MRRTSRFATLPSAAILGVALAACATASPGAGSTDAGIIPPPPTVDGSVQNTNPDAGNSGGIDAATSMSCKLFDQTTCAPGGACDVDFSAPTVTVDGGTSVNAVCRAVTTPGTATSTCKQPQDCAAGYSCIAPGQCRRYCQTDSDCNSGPGSACAFTLVDGNGNTIPGVRLCSDDCDPLTGARCPATYACHYSFIDPDNDPNHNNGDEKYITDCDPTPASGGGNGADCSKNGNADCKAGFVCITFTDGTGTKTNQCKQACDLASPSCATGSCTNLATPATIGTHTYGFCN